MKYLLSLTIIFAAIIVACGDDSGNEFDFSAAALSSPFASSSGEAAVLKGSRAFNSLYQEREDLLQTLLVTAATPAECTFDLDIFTPGARANCFGPMVEVAGTHPDTSAAVPGFNTMGNPLPGGDLGIWNSTSPTSSEACTASQFTSIMGYTNEAFFSQVVSAAAYCFARTSELSIPEGSGDDILTFTADQLSAFGFTKASKTITFSKVELSPTTNSDGDFALKIVVNGTVDSRGFGSRASIFSDGFLFSGKFSYYLRNSAGSEGNCSATGLAGTTSAGTMYISRPGASDDVKITLHSGVYCGTTYDPLGTNDAVNYCDTAGNAAVSNDTDSGNGWGGNWVYLNFAFNSITGAGQYIQGWQAGKGDSHVRTLNVDLTSGSAGTGYFGYSAKLATGSESSCTAATNPGKIGGMICNWAGAGAQDHATQLAASPYVQKQVMTKTAGVWGVTSESIRYAPTNSCQDTVGASYTYFAIAGTGDRTELNYSNDDDTDGIAGLSGGDSIRSLGTLTDYESAFTVPSEAEF